MIHMILVVFDTCKDMIRLVFRMFYCLTCLKRCRLLDEDICT